MLASSGIAWRKCFLRCDSFCCYSKDNGEVTYAAGHCPCVRFLWLYEFQVWKFLDSP